MTATTFDTLVYFEKLKAAGVPEAQAKVQAEAIKGIIDDKLVTRDHFEGRIKELEYRLTIRFGSMIAAAVAILAAFMALWK